MDSVINKLIRFIKTNFNKTFDRASTEFTLLDLSFIKFDPIIRVFQTHHILLNLKKELL